MKSAEYTIERMRPSEHSDTSWEEAEREEAESFIKL